MKHEPLATALNLHRYVLRVHLYGSKLPPALFPQGSACSKSDWAWDTFACVLDQGGDGTEGDASWAFSSRALALNMWCAAPPSGERLGESKKQGV